MNQRKKKTPEIERRNESFRERRRGQNAEKLAENGRREDFTRVRVFIESRSPSDVFNKETRLLNRETLPEIFNA